MIDRKPGNLLNLNIGSQGEMRDFFIKYLIII